MPGPPLHRISAFRTSPPSAPDRSCRAQAPPSLQFRTPCDPPPYSRSCTAPTGHFTLPHARPAPEASSPIELDSNRETDSARSSVNLTIVDREGKNLGEQAMVAVKVDGMNPGTDYQGIYTCLVAHPRVKVYWRPTLNSATRGKKGRSAQEPPALTGPRSLSYVSTQRVGRSFSLAAEEEGKRLGGHTLFLYVSGLRRWPQDRD
jgi:hypothetical protein